MRLAARAPREVVGLCLIAPAGRYGGCLPACKPSRLFCRPALAYPCSSTTYSDTCCAATSEVLGVCGRRRKGNCVCREAVYLRRCI